MNRDETWGYPYEKIREYLLSCGAEAEGDRYVLAGCSVELEVLPDRQAGGLSLAQTRVKMTGPGTDEFHHSFKLHFLSGGA